MLWPDEVLPRAEVEGPVLPERGPRPSACLFHIHCGSWSTQAPKTREFNVKEERSSAAAVPLSASCCYMGESHGSERCNRLAQGRPQGSRGNAREVRDRPLHEIEACSADLPSTNDACADRGGNFLPCGPQGAG